MVLIFDGLLFFAHAPPSDGLEEVRRTRMANLQEGLSGEWFSGRGMIYFCDAVKQTTSSSQINELFLTIMEF